MKAYHEIFEVSTKQGILDEKFRTIKRILISEYQK